MKGKHITRSLVLRLIFCSILITLALIPDPKNYDKQHTNDNLGIGSSNSVYASNLSKGASEDLGNPDTSGLDGGSVIEKAVVIMFDRAYDTQFTNARPILEKYGFKTSFFVICSFVEGSGYHKLSNNTELRSQGTNSMNWDQIRQLYKDGHDIQSHGMEHRDLRHLSMEELEYEIGGSKECLESNGLRSEFFQFPSNKGHDNLTVLNMVSKFFDYGMSDHSTLMFLNCDGWVNHGFKTQSYKYQHNCNPYNTDGSPSRTNKYSIREWSHDREHTSLNKKNPQLLPHGPEMSELMFNQFVRIVEAQNQYNSKAGKIVAFPIIGYHQISNTSSYDTSIELFDREMKYLYDNGYKVLKLTDLGYNDTNHYFYIK